MEYCRLLLRSCYLQRSHGLLRRKMRKQVCHLICIHVVVLTRNSIATRIAYALILLINSIVSWIMLTDWAMKKLSHLTLDYVDIKCHGEQCYGYVAVQRINFALGFFHVLMALMLIGVRSSKDGRAPIQNGFWAPKILGWIGMIVLTFFIPNSFFIVWGNYFAMIGACLFLLIGLILLVDLAHNWAEYCQEKIEVGESRLWTGMLVGSAVTMYLASFAMTIVMYIYFARSGCGMNQAAITVCSATILHVHILTLADQLDPPARIVYRLNPPRRTERQPACGSRTICHRRRLLHLPHPLRCWHGTG
jgi:hypothetical protein